MDLTVHKGEAQSIKRVIVKRSMQNVSGAGPRLCE